jgi:hypothetical protein
MLLQVLILLALPIDGLGDELFGKIVFRVGE